MVPCPSCNRHLRAADASCPFCGATRALPFGRAFQAIGGAVTTLVLAACYGAPPGSFDKVEPDTAMDTAVDADDDGFGADVDCDDANAAINPDAAEVCDDEVDNDCDDAVDAADTDCVTER